MAQSTFCTDPVACSCMDTGRICLKTARCDGPRRMATTDGAPKWSVASYPPLVVLPRSRSRRRRQAGGRRRRQAGGRRRRQGGGRRRLRRSGGRRRLRRSGGRRRLRRSSRRLRGRFWRRRWRRRGGRFGCRGNRCGRRVFWQGRCRPIGQVGRRIAAELRGEGFEAATIEKHHPATHDEHDQGELADQRHTPERANRPEFARHWCHSLSCSE